MDCGTRYFVDLCNRASQGHIRRASLSSGISSSIFGISITQIMDFLISNIQVDMQISIKNIQNSSE